MKKTNYEVLGTEEIIDLIGKKWMLVTAGTREKYNMMTASWGGMGWLWNKPVAFIFIRPERYTHELIEAGGRITLSFYAEEYRKALQVCGTKSGRDTDKTQAAGLSPIALDSGAVSFAQARLTLDCHKLFKTSMHEADFIDKELLEKWYGSHGGLHDVYVVEIDEVYFRDCRII